MRFKKIQAAVIASIMVISASSCGNKTPESTSSSDTTTTVSDTTSAASDNTTAVSDNTTAVSDNATTTTSTPAATESTTDFVPVQTDPNSVMVYYGWDIDDTDCVAEIHCPEGAKFGDFTLEVQERDGWVLSADVSDDVKEYSATSNSYWHRDAYLDDVYYLSILQQLYFDGEIDADTAKEYSGCSQKVTPLGFQWQGKDVIMIETTYTFMDYSEQTDIFVGVEYDLNYWKTDESTHETINLTTKGLFGFDMFSSGWNKLTQEQCAWIIGELLGVESGVEDPFANNSDASGDLPADVDPSSLIGTWVDEDSVWKDTYFFDYNGNGSYKSGFESTFTYSVEGDILTVFYAEDDIDIFTVKVFDDAIVLVDEYGFEQYFVKMDDDAVNSGDIDEYANPNAAAIIGTWKESETGTDETFTFNDDGTGYYSCISGDEIYECGFTYNFFSADYIDIYFDDGDIGGFLLAIDGDTMTVKNDFVFNLVYTRQ